jgi:hypothetical protein
MTQLRSPVFAVLALLAATFAAYWSGLHGGWLLDDATALDIIPQWLKGEAVWQDVVAHQAVGLIGRPVAMASFMLSAVIGGYSPFSFKLGNLVLHALNGVLVYLLYRRMSRMAGLTASPWPAVVLMAVWLLHPLFVSTTLYAVQRMTILATGFVLLALLAYLAGRQAMQDGRVAKARLLLFLLLPLLVLLGTLCKQNAAITPVLCGIIEVMLLSNRAPHGRRDIAAFYGMFIALPALLACGLFLARPESFFISYSEYDFTMAERLLSQPRVLMEYLGQLLIPRGPRMGIFTDDYVFSHSLVAPPTTLLSILALLAITGLAAAVRKQEPLVLAGWLFFLAAHAIEASFLPLDLYFEHRNYLPAIGLFPAVAALFRWLIHRVPSQGQLSRTAPLLAGLVVLLLAAATWARASVWRDTDLMMAQAAPLHPHSRFLQMSLAQAAMNRPEPDVRAARGYLHSLAQSPNPSNRAASFINLGAIDCLQDQPVDPAVITGLPGLRKVTPGPGTVTSINNLANLVMSRGCKGLTSRTFADALVAWLDKDPYPENVRAKSRLRITAYSLYVHAGDLPLAWDQLEIAWTNGRNEPGTSFARLDLLVRQGETEQAQRFADALGSQATMQRGRNRDILRAYIELLQRSSGALEKQR